MTLEIIEKLEAKHEKECLTLIDERDAAEQSLSQAYYLTIGHSPEWSNNFGHQHALQDIGDAVALLKDAAKSAIERAERYRVACVAAIAAWEADEIGQLDETYIDGLRRVALKEPT